MATIPRLNRIQPTTQLAQPGNARINMQVQDKGSMILNQTNQLAAVGDKVGDIYQKYEDDKIETISTEVESKFKSWNDQELAKLKSIEGDPTKAYAEYETKRKEKHDEITASYGDVSDRVKRHVTSRFDKVIGNESIAADKQRGAQQETYDNNMFEANVKMKKDNLPVVAGYVSKDDPSSFGMFEQGLHDIKTTIAKRGLKKGTVTQLPDDATEGISHTFQDDDGNIVKVAMSPIAKQRVAKEISEGVKNSIDVLLAGGQTEEARLMRERYKGALDPVAASKIEKKFQKTGYKDEAYSVLNSLKGKTEDQQIEAIDKISNLEVKSEVLKIKDTNDKRMQSLRDRKAKVNYNTLASYVLDKQNSEQPFYGLADLEEDPNYKQVYDNLDVKGKIAIEQMIESPKVSNDKALVKVNSLLMGETDADLEKMTVEDFHKDYLVGLSKGDRTKALNDFERLKHPTAAQERSNLKQANEYVKNQLFLSGYIKENDYGRYEGEDKVKLLEMQNKMKDYLSTRKTPPTDTELRKLAKELAASAIDERAFRPNDILGKNAPAGNSGQARKTPNTITKDTNPDDILKKYTATQIVNFKGDFERQFKFTPKKSDPRFLQFIEGRK
jgi:hypothetical protein